MGVVRWWFWWFVVASIGGMVCMLDLPLFCGSEAIC